MNRNVTWSSSDESVATVDENGLVTYIKPGYCTIVCKQKMVHLLQPVILL